MRLAIGRRGGVQHRHDRVPGNFTDPSYSGQIVTLTYPHIGNTGVNAEDVEANRVYASGLVSATVRPACRTSVPRNRCRVPCRAGHRRHFRHRHPAARASAREGRPGRLHLRRQPTPSAPSSWRAAPAWPARTGPRRVHQGPRRLDPGHLGAGRRLHRARPVRFHVVAYDFGVKSNILRLLADRGCRITLVPAQTTADEVLKLNPDGVPVQRPRRPRALRLRHRSHPQVPGPEAARVRHLPGPPDHGPGGGRQDRQDEDRPPRRQPPVQDLASKRVFITSQNHGFAVDAASLPANAHHASLFDGTLQGFELTDRPAFCFQGHPEASPARTTSSCCSTSSSA